MTSPVIDTSCFTLCTSTTGTLPVTVIDSVRGPSRSWALTDVVNDPVSSTSSCW